LANGTELMKDVEMDEWKVLEWDLESLAKMLEELLVEE
jgi:hypothetical protein